MTRDYANKRSKPRKKSASASRKPATKPSTPAGTGSKFFTGLLTGLFAGIILGTLIDFGEMFSQTAEEVLPEVQTSKPATPTKPRFDFYTLLRESEVIVSENETPILSENLPPDEPATGQPATQSEDIYLLQVGSFKTAADADSLRVNLLLLNLDAHIEKVSPKSGETWHRVLVGPLDSRTQVAEARDKLESNRIDSLLLKRKR